jgi:hypothetical protein
MSPMAVPAVDQTHDTATPLKRLPSAPAIEMAVEGVINLSESDRDSENNKQIFPRLRQPIFGSQLFDSPIICCGQPGTWP